MKQRVIATLIIAISAIGAWGSNTDSCKMVFTDLKLGIFIHFGVNTYTAHEWTDGTVPAWVFNPKKLDTDQWCKAASDAGMKYVVFTAKHHDGFCNWPTAYTKYSVASSPFRGDVIKDLAASCGKYGLKLGLYYSLWDRNYAQYSNSYLYTEYMKNQLTELLTQYGDILLVWFDGVWDKFPGFKSANAETLTSRWREEGTLNWQWDQIYAHIKHTAPNCLVMNNSGVEWTGIPLMPVDIRTGERAKAEVARNRKWDFGGKTYDLPMQIEDIISKKYWFFHAGDTTVRSGTMLQDMIHQARNMGANLLLNVGPNTDGLLRPQDVAVLKTLKAE